MQVNFDAPRVSLAGGIDLAIGPKSQVQITTTYLTPEVRMGKGGRGSLFVFTKGGPADSAGDAQLSRCCQYTHHVDPAVTSPC